MCKHVMKFCLILFMTFGCGAAAAEEVTVFAAASTTNAVTEIVQLYKDLNMGSVTTSFASSSTLAKQISNGAPAHIFISANTKWMDYLEAGKAIIPVSRRNLLANSLVLISPDDNPVQIAMDEGFDLKALLNGGYLAMGDSSHVPAGMYARKALEYMGQWDAVKGLVSNSKDVRGALLLVERGETPFGIVYATDAKISEKVHVAGVFPASSHPAIIYPVATTKDGDTPAAHRFMDFLSGRKAAEIFTKYGFERM